MAKIEVEKERFVCSKTEFSINSYGLNEAAAPHITQIATYIEGRTLEELLINLKDYFNGNNSKITDKTAIKKITDNWILKNRFKSVTGLNPPHAF